MGRSPCCDKAGLKKGPWTPEEDQKLLAYIQQHGHGSWRALPPKAGLRRCGKSCRLRWTNYLRPDIKRGEFSLQEQQTIIQLHALLGNRWSAIASHLPKRTDNEIKNYWNTHLKKRLTKMGIDPTTHKPKSHALGSGQTKDIANLSHMAQWETARLEAEARIVRESKMNSNSTYHHHHNNNNNNSRLAIIKEAAPPAQRPPCLDILKVWQGTWLAKGKKDISIVNGFFGHHQLESPTSILNFSDNNNNNNMIKNIPNHVGLNAIHENTLLESVNYMESVGACTNNIGDEQLKGIMGDITDVPINSSSANSSNMFPESLISRYPSFLEGYGDDIPTEAGSSTDNLLFTEDNYKMSSYWNNVLNSVGSPIDSTVF